MNVHCIGDSHTGFFSGYNHILPEYPAVGRSRVSNIFLHRIGAPLAYNLCEANSKSQSREKLFSILAGLNTNTDYILLCFGEIDCRAHLLRHAEKSGKPVNIVVEECVDRYLTVVKQICQMGFRVGLWNAVPSADGIYDPQSEFPYYGSSLERNKATLHFNNLLGHYSTIVGYDFFRIFDWLTDQELSTRSEFYFDLIHLNSILLSRTLSLMQRQVSALRFSFSDMMRLRLNTSKYKMALAVERYKRDSRIFKLSKAVKRKLLG